MLRHEAREVRRDAERAPVDLGQAEGRVVGGDHDVGVAGEPDTAAEAEALHRRDHRDLAVVDRAERLVATAVDLDQTLVGGVGGELLDVDAGLEALARRLEDDDAHVGVAAGGAQRVGEVEPARDGQRVHGRVVDGHGRDVSRAVSERIMRGSLCEDAAMNARIEELLGELTLDEKAVMVAGVDLWHTAAVPRLGHSRAQGDRRPGWGPG